MTKLCSKCGVNPKRKSGVWCNTCAAEWQRVKYQSNPEYRAKAMATRRARRQADPELRKRANEFQKEWRARHPGYMKSWLAKHPNYFKNYYRQKLGLPPIPANCKTK
jgi:hypothetical protein